VEDLRLLVQSRYPILYVETFDEERLVELLARVASDLGLPFYAWSVTQGLTRHGSDQPELLETRQPAKLLERIAETRVPSLFLLRDFHPYLSDPAIVRSLRELAQGPLGRLATLVLCSPSLEIPPELQKVAARYRLALPSADEIRTTVIETFRELKRGRALRYGLDEEQMHRLVDSLRGLTLAEVRRLVTRCTLEDRALDAKDIPTVLAAKKEGLAQSGLLELCAADGELAPLGGLGNLKGWLHRFRVGWSDNAKRLGLGPPRGVLLMGIQGCGKSLAAKTIAREWGLPLVRLDPGRLYDKYIGESERHLRTAFETAEALSPLVLWIDEIEKVFAAGGAESDGGLGRRLFGSFLTWMQEKKEAVFVAATSNDLSAVPPELLRKGRFDEIFFVDLPGSPERTEILAIHLRLRRQDPAAFDLEVLTEATEGMSGAEIEQAVVAALYGMLAEGETRLTTARILAEIGRTVPLSRSRREQVETLRALARERFVLAG
jgi:ATPase family protein associated with various cellular activities (AAA)